MPVDDLRDAIHGLMGRARDDLAELVRFKSVADPKQYPPEECEAAAQWVVDAFTEVGLQDVTASPTPDGSAAVHGLDGLSKSVNHGDTSCDTDGRSRWWRCVRAGKAQ